MLTSSCTDAACTCAPGRSELPDGLSGGTNSTDLAPKTVVLAMRTTALDGM